MKILLIDPQQQIQHPLQGWIESWGHIFSSITSFADAPSSIEQTRPDIVIAQCSAGTGSLEFCRDLTQNRQFPVYIVGYSTEIPPGGMAEVCDDYLDAPLEQHQLLMRLQIAQRFLNLRSVLAEQNRTLNNLVDKLAASLRSIESDLQAASEIQLSLLPTESDIHPSVAVDWLVMPSSFLAGDNLNYFMMLNRYLVFYHLDVAGHGIPSALLAVTLNHLLSPQPGSPVIRMDPNMQVKRMVPPIEVVSELNRRFQPQGDGYFTMVYGLLDTHSGEVRLCQAGHPNPIIVSPTTAIRPVGEGGFPVGLWPNIAYEETTAQLECGEKLVIFSDGLLACTDRAGAVYSAERIAGLLAANSLSPVTELLRTIQADIESWSSGRSLPDDISVLVIEYKG